MKAQIPKTTSGEWKFIRHIHADPGVNLLVSAWLWESSREALILDPRCLDWFWDWRERHFEDIEAAQKGSRESIRNLWASEPGRRLSAWMFSPDFPESSLCSQAVWNRFKALAKILPPCGGADNPDEDHVRHRGYPSFGPDEFLPLIEGDEHLEEMGVIHRSYFGDSSDILILPVGLDLRKSNEFLIKSLAHMVATLRDEYERQFGKVEVRDTRGKSGELARTRARLNRLAAKRLMEAIEEKRKLDRKISLIKEAAKRCKEARVYLYSAASASSWYHARRQAQEDATEMMEILDGLNGDKCLDGYKARLAERERQLNSLD